MKRILCFGAVLLAAVACIKDEPKNSECDILSASVDEALAEHFYTPSAMSISEIASNTSEIVFTVKEFKALPKAVAVSFTLTPGATISPESGSEQDFTAGAVVYTVTSEDGEWKREYSVAFRESFVANKFSFENYETKAGFYEGSGYHVFYEQDEAGNKHYIWDCGNLGAATLNTGGPEAFPTYSAEGGYSGRCVCLNTQSAGALAAWLKKPIAAGNLFIGNFIANDMMAAPLKATEFGMPINKEPLKVTGWYKYSPGAEFTDKDSKVLADRTDEASIYGVFWRNEDENGNEVKLYGDDVLTNPLIVSKAQVKSLPETDTWAQFEMFFEGGSADAEILAKYGYSFTLVFSSSKDGASFEGAIGSTLYIDEVEISFKED